MEDIMQLIEGQPKYRRDQILTAWFDVHAKGYGDITTLPKDLREKLSSVPWMYAELFALQESQEDQTKKALLRLADGALVETVLMGRVDKKFEAAHELRYTICISTQVGCPMGCVFCATGKMGFGRNLSWQEIVDEIRFWRMYLDENVGESGRISNIVLMGQGEPLLNYDNVKTALNIILKYTDIGPRQITLSTVGVPKTMEKMVADPEWPPVRFALSLHNAIEEERKKLIPSHQKDFLKWLVGWSKTYHERFNSRTQFIGIEYTIVPGENDSDKHLKALIKLASKLGKVRINLIPLNMAALKTTAPDKEIMDRWHHALMDVGFTSTIRRSQGQDIAAACGQLASQCK